MSMISALAGVLSASGSGPLTFPVPGSANPGGYLTQTTSAQGAGYLDPGGYLTSIPSPAVTGSLIRRAYSGLWANTSSYNNNNPGIFNGTPLETLADSFIDFGNQSTGSDNYCMEWKGYFKPSYSSGGVGPWNFQTTGDDVCMLWIGLAALTPTNENWICNNGVNSGLNLQSPTLIQNKWYPIRIRYQEWGGDELCGVYGAAVGWVPQSIKNNGSIGYCSTTDGYGISWQVSGVEAYTADLGSNTYRWDGYPTNFMSIIYSHGGYDNGVVFYPVGNPGAAVSVTGHGGNPGLWEITFSGPLGAGPFVVHSE